MIGQKVKNTALLTFLPEQLEKIRSTELYHAPLEGLTIFLYRSSTSRPPLDRSLLAELKYAFLSRRGRNTKKLRHKPFPIDNLQACARRGSTFLFQYSSISRTKALNQAS